MAKVRRRLGLPQGGGLLAGPAPRIIPTQHPSTHPAPTHLQLAEPHKAMHVYGQEDDGEVEANGVHEVNEDNGADAQGHTAQRPVRWMGVGV